MEAVGCWLVKPDDDTLAFRLRRAHDQEQVTIKSAAPLLYESEVQSITMLGSEEQLDWRLTPEGLIIRRPTEKPCEHAYVFKIARCRPF